MNVEILILNSDNEYVKEASAIVLAFTYQNDDVLRSHVEARKAIMGKGILEMILPALFVDAASVLCVSSSMYDFMGVNIKNREVRQGFDGIENYLELLLRRKQ